MTRDAPLQLSIEIDLDGDRVRGIVRHEATSEMSFRGWLELLATLERIRALAVTRNEKQRPVAEEAS